jgi:hypothetical protein
MQEDVKVEELEEEGQEIEIEDNNEQESNEVSVETKTKSENDEDLSEYSDSVKKRISKLQTDFVKKKDKDKQQ